MEFFPQVVRRYALEALGQLGVLGRYGYSSLSFRSFYVLECE